MTSETGICWRKPNWKNRKFQTEDESRRDSLPSLFRVASGHSCACFLRSVLVILYSSETDRQVHRNRKPAFSEAYPALDTFLRLHTAELCELRRTILQQSVPEKRLLLPGPAEADSQDIRLQPLPETDFFFMRSSSSFKI